jgi:hypothetical protein
MYSAKERRFEVNKQDLLLQINNQCSSVAEGGYCYGITVSAMNQQSMFNNVYSVTYEEPGGDGVRQQHKEEYAFVGNSALRYKHSIDVSSPYAVGLSTEHWELILKRVEQQPFTVKL